MTWSQSEKSTGKLVHIKNFPKGHRVKLFRLAFSSKRTIYVVTNDLSQDSAEATDETCPIHWKIERFHRETKQVTGLEKCQYRQQRAQRNHIGCAILVWVKLNKVA